MISTDEKLISELLDRGVENIFPNRDFLETQLKSGKQLTIYLGIDPTGPTLHLGHAINLKRLGLFQQLGHKIILLIGSFTAMIGDPTDKLAARKPLTRKQVMDNCKLYKKQAETFLRFHGANKAELRFNHKWFDKLTFDKILNLTSNFTVQQMMERDMFEKRQQEGKPIGLHEFLYPVMQAYDSIALHVDGEIGGNDQTFNMLAGRDLVKSMENREKFVLTNKLLTDTTGKKMGKSEGNMLTLEDSPEDKFGKVMSWTDGMILGGFELCTDVPVEQINEYKTQLETDANPRDIKLELAFQVVKIYHGEEAAHHAKENFIQTFSKKETPDEMPEITPSAYDIVTVLTESKLVTSNSEAKQQLKQNAVKVNQAVVTDMNFVVKPDDIIQKGKRFFVRVK